MSEPVPQNKNGDKNIAVFLYSFIQPVIYWFRFIKKKLFCTFL